MPFSVVDIFAGPGGLGEGFASLKDKNGRRVFKNVLSIEKEELAHKTLSLRSFFRQFEPNRVPKEYWQYIKDEISRDELFKLYPKQAAQAAHEAICIELGKASHKLVTELISERIKDNSKWALVGGPPCQAYSFIGRSRMRSTNPDFEKDARHFLYLEYLKILADHAPPVFVMENVKGLLSATHSGSRMIERILCDLKNPGNALKRTVNNSEYNLYSFTVKKSPDEYSPEDFLIKFEKYGIPQARHRILIFGIRKDFKITPDILKLQDGPSVEDVIGDLPKIRSTISKGADSMELWKQVLESCQSEKWYEGGKANGLFNTMVKLDKSVSRLDKVQYSTGGEVLCYVGTPKVYSKWYRANCEDVISNHSSRGHMRSDLQRYFFSSSYALANNRSPNLINFPKALLPLHKNLSGKITEVSFVDRFKVQIKSKPSTTITSHISKDGHYFIHYDPLQCRSLTVREAARLQTFPDNYKFEGSRTSQYHQVGNAVPPMLAVQIAEVVSDVLKKIRI